MRQSLNPLFRNANIVKFLDFILDAPINNISEKAGVLDYRSSEMSCARLRDDRYSFPPL